MFACKILQNLITFLLFGKRALSIIFDNSHHGLPILTLWIEVLIKPQSQANIYENGYV